MRINPKILKQLEFAEDFIKNDLDSSRENHNRVIDVLINLQTFFVESKLDIPKWKNSIGPLTTKAILHANSINYLMKGTSFKNPSNNQELKILDIPSVYVLVRAQIENLLMIDYLYVNGKNDSECEFRHDCWMYSGLIARINKDPIGEPLKEQQKKDKIELEYLKDKIDKSQFFHNLFNRDKRKFFFKYGSPRLSKKWTDLAQESKLNDILFANLYSALSNHAHSEALGTLNLGSKKLGYHKNHEESCLLILLSQIIFCLVIKSFIKMFKVLEFEYNMLDRETRNLIDFSAKMGKRNK